MDLVILLNGNVPIVNISAFMGKLKYFSNLTIANTKSFVRRNLLITTSLFMAFRTLQKIFSTFQRTLVKRTKIAIKR